MSLAGHWKRFGARAGQRLPAISVAAYSTVSGVAQGSVVAMGSCKRVRGVGGPARHRDRCWGKHYVVVDTMMANTARAIVAVAGIAVGALVVATPCAADPPARPKTDQKQVTFIDYLTKNGVPYVSVPKAVALAHSTCAILAATNSPTRIQDAATAIQNSISMRPEQMQTFAGAATTVYCPDVKV